jgi:hypothetical protein
MVTGVTFEGFTLTPHLNNLYDNYRTINYSLISVDLYLTESAWQPYAVLEVDDYMYDYLQGRQITRTFIEDANTNIEGVQPKQFVDYEEQKRLVIGGYSNLIDYSDTNEGIIYFRECCNDSGAEDMPSPADMGNAIGELINLSNTVIERHLIRFHDLTYKLVSALSLFWEDVNPRVGEYVIQSHSTLAFLDSYCIGLNFLPVNKPFSDTGRELVFGSEFLEDFEYLAKRKIDSILLFLLQVERSTGVRLSGTNWSHLDRWYGKGVEGEQANEVTPSMDSSKPLSVPELAMMYVYLHAAGWFGITAPSTYFRANHNDPSIHGFSGNSVANTFSSLKKKRDDRRLDVLDIPRIEKAIELLQSHESGLTGPISLAKDDLKTIRERLPGVAL